MAIEIRIAILDAHYDPQLVANRYLKQYKVKKEDMVSYHKHAFQILGTLGIVIL